MIQDIDQKTSLHLNNEAQFLCFTLDDSNPLALFPSNQDSTSPQNLASPNAQNLAQNLANVAGNTNATTAQNGQNLTAQTNQNEHANHAHIQNTMDTNNPNTTTICPHCGGAVCPHCGNVVDSAEISDVSQNPHLQNLAQNFSPQESEKNLAQNPQDSIYSGAFKSTNATSTTHNKAQNSLITNLTAHNPQNAPHTQNLASTQNHTQSEIGEKKSHAHPLLENLESSVFSPTSGEKMGEQLYAINVFKVREIIYYDGEITETAGEKDGLVLGFLTVRGESMPLIDMRRWLYFSSNDPHRDLRPFSINSQKSLVVICHFSSQNIGLKILGVKRIINKNWGEITAGGEFGFDGESKVVATTKYDDGSVIQILDVERMVADAFPDMTDSNRLEISNLQAIHSNKLILVAEDSKSASKALGLILEHLHLHYMSFANGEGLLDYLYSEGVASQVGAVITDLEMPKISGFEVLKRIKNNPESRGIPVIVNSSMSSDSNVEMAQKLGADAFISKSNPAEVEEHLRRFLI